MDQDRISLPRTRFDRVFRIVAIVALVAIPALHIFLSRAHALFAVLTALIVLLGFGLPRWIGYAIRKERAELRKTEEQKKWGFHSRDRDGPWINYVDHPVVRRARCADGKRFCSEWLLIHDGLVIVNPGPSTVTPAAGTVVYDFSIRRAYAWDGCTPKKFFYWFAVLGTPDWWHAAQTIQTIKGQNTIVSQSVVWQIAHHASLVHDALYQYLDHIPVPKQEVDRLFFEMLIESGMPRILARLYYAAVVLFGPKAEASVMQNARPAFRLVTPDAFIGSGAC